MLNIIVMSPSPAKVLGAIILMYHLAAMFFYDALCRYTSFAHKMMINYNFFIWLGSCVESSFLLHWISVTGCLVLLLNKGCKRCNDQLDKIRLKEINDLNDLMRFYEELAEPNDPYSPRPRIQMDFTNTPGPAIVG